MNRSGSFIKNDSGYLSFRPSNLCDVEKSLKLDEQINKLLNKIYVNFAKINTMSELIIDFDLFLYTYVYEEALESSKIEGTMCTMEDIFSNIKKEKIEKNINDILETISNISAIEEGIKKLETLPLGTRFFRELHKVLLNNTRGQDKFPGEIRTSQNWIGGNSIKNAKFIPPNIRDMNESLKQFDDYLNSDKSIVDKIIKTALIHYQFETIHPFIDGNGRLGRIIILLYLLREKLLLKPIVYISYYLKINQLEYYNKLMDVRINDKYEEYIKFFLECLYQATESSITRINTINELHVKNLKKLPKSNRKKDVNRIVFNYIEKTPIFNIIDVHNTTKLSFNTVNTVVKTLETLDIVKIKTQIKRNRVYIYKEYLEIFESIDR